MNHPLDDDGHTRCFQGHRICEGCGRCACVSVTPEQGYPSGRVIVSVDGPDAFCQPCHPEH